MAAHDAADTDDPVDRALSELVQLHQRRCVTFRRCVIALVVSTIGLAACVLHRNHGIDMPVHATAALVVAAFALAMVEVHAIRNINVRMDSLRHRLCARRSMPVS